MEADREAGFVDSQHADLQHWVQATFLGASGSRIIVPETIALL